METTHFWKIYKWSNTAGEMTTQQNVHLYFKIGTYIFKNSKIDGF